MSNRVRVRSQLERTLPVSPCGLGSLSRRMIGEVATSPGKLAMGLATTMPSSHLALGPDVV